jgi:hypothetical protein
MSMSEGVQKRQRTETELTALYNEAIRLYGSRILGSADLDRLSDLKERAAVAARAMIDKGDARAFFIGRQLLDLVRLLSNEE